MEYLPDEILLKIFSNLKLVDLVENARLTCMRFWSLTYDLSLWRDITFGTAESMSHPFQDTLRECSDGVVILTIDGEQSEGLKILLGEKINFTNLKRLYLRCPGLSADDFMTLVELYAPLETMTIQYYAEKDVLVLINIKQMYNLHYVIFKRVVLETYIYIAERRVMVEIRSGMVQPRSGVVQPRSGVVTSAGIRRSPYHCWSDCSLLSRIIARMNVFCVDKCGRYCSCEQIEFYLFVGGFIGFIIYIIYVFTQ